MTPFPQVLPPSAELTPDGHLAIGGCDVVELASRFGTPLVIYDEGLLRATAREFVRTLAAAAPDSEVVYEKFKSKFGITKLKDLPADQKVAAEMWLDATGQLTPSGAAKPEETEVDPFE